MLTKVRSVKCSWRQVTFRALVKKLNVVGITWPKPATPNILTEATLMGRAAF